MITKVSPENCTLCGACINSCRVHAIVLDYPYLDFYYPRIHTDRCIHCKQCEKSCPVLGEKQLPASGYPLAFAAKSNDDSVRMQSSSGGLFYELASHILRTGGYVCGAVFDEDFHVKHIVSNSHQDLLRMMGSKYVQSDMGLCYRQIQEKLQAGHTVLFSGCPCQVAGLRIFLGKAYSNLLLVELICHGIPSDQMLQAYISLREKQYGSKLQKLEFRSKQDGWHCSCVRMEFENAKVYRNPISTDAYMQGFLGNMLLKPACYHCSFRNFTAGSDLILGDFWGAEVVFSEIDDNKGLSAVLVNTDRGKALLDACSVALFPSNPETIIQYNQNLIASSIPNPQRDAFFAYAEAHGFASAIRSFLEETAAHKIKRKSRQFLRRLWYAIRGKHRPLY